MKNLVMNYQIILLIQKTNFKLIQNGTNPNFILIDVLEDKKSIDINQVRNLNK